MKTLELIRCLIAILLVITFGCRNLGSEPPIVEEPPIIEVVPYDAIPQPFTDLDFWRIGLMSPDRSGPIRDALLNIGVPVHEAWESHSSLCAVDGAPMALQIIIRLRSQDSRVREFGFVPAGDANVDECWTSWLHYRF